MAWESRRDQHKSVYEQFVQAKLTASKKASGNGIGLYVSKMIVDGHKANIGPFTENHDHTTMYSWLPNEPVAASND
jgi:signal transduction histidine kinase